jgi:hypothetical protein
MLEFVGKLSGVFIKQFNGREDLATAADSSSFGEWVAQPL